MNNKIYFKNYISIMVLLSLFFLISGCAINPATGERQFTALMSPAQENKIGVSEHPNILQSFGGEYDSKKLEAYINKIGKRLVPHTERGDVDYKFFILDTAGVNAFAVPGGYIYVTRGLLALADNEAELAGVLAHEIGHITARHSAERYSRGVITSLGASILSASIDSPQASRLVGLGSNLYLKSYSRQQEHQADELGLRYMAKAGYHAFSMGDFLGSLGRLTEFNSKSNGNSKSFDYFATHPKTDDRVYNVTKMAVSYASFGNEKNKIAHYKAIKNMSYGDSAKSGFVRGNSFYHPVMGFKFDVPKNYKIQNNSNNITAFGKNGGVIIFDKDVNDKYNNPYDYMVSGWMKDEKLNNKDEININGFSAATSTFSGYINGKSLLIRLIAIEWEKGEFFRYQIAIPHGLSDEDVKSIKVATYSFSRMTKSDKNKYKPYYIDVVAASKNDDISKFVGKMKLEENNKELFMIHNHLEHDIDIKEGGIYKIMTDK